MRPELNVGYHDLDLNSPKGRSKLVRRIHAAVDMICPDSNDLVTFVEPRELCVRTATQSGLSQMKDIVAR